MGKLNIAHHKSYHPYRRDNIERVRRDEEEARLREEKEEGRMMLADSEARINRLRERAGITPSSKSKHRKDDDDMAALSRNPTSQPSDLPTVGGHINFFQDLEQNTIASAIKASRTIKKAEPVETDKGVPLAPSAKDLKPWYSQQKVDDKNQQPSEEEDKERRELARKSRNDPLTSITQQLAGRSSLSSSSSLPWSYQSRPSQSKASTHPPELQARLSRESSERQRALDLIRKKKKEMEGSMTPSTVHGDYDISGYADQFNRREVEEAHRGWGQNRETQLSRRGWDDRDRDARRTRNW